MVLLDDEDRLVRRRPRRLSAPASRRSAAWRGRSRPRPSGPTTWRSRGRSTHAARGWSVHRAALCSRHGRGTGHDRHQRAAEPVSGLWLAPPAPRACLVLAHGAGAGMAHRSMAAIAEGLAERGRRHPALPVPVHGDGRQAGRSAAGRPRRGAGRPSPRPPAAPASAAVRRRPLVRRPHDLAGPGPRAAGGRARPGVLRLPAAPGRQAARSTRAAHSVGRADPDAVPAGDEGHARRARPAAGRLSPGSATGPNLVLAEDADHAFHVPARTGRKDADVLAALLDRAAAWMGV